MAPLRLLLAAAITVTLGCARPPRPSYTFDPQVGGWELDEHTLVQGVNNERFQHPVHTERLELFEVARAAPAATSEEFGGLQTPSRALPTLGTLTAAPRPIGDDTVNGMRGYWVEQHGREGDAGVERRHGRGPFHTGRPVATRQRNHALPHGRVGSCPRRRE